LLVDGSRVELIDKPVGHSKENAKHDIENTKSQEQLSPAVLEENVASKCIAKCYSCGKYNLVTLDKLFFEYFVKHNRMIQIIELK